MEAMGFRGSVELQVHVNATTCNLIQLSYDCRSMKNSKILQSILVTFDSTFYFVSAITGSLTTT